MANLFFFFLNQTQITFLFMGYRFTSITLKLKPVCCTRVRRHNSISVELGVTGLAHVYEVMRILTTRSSHSYRLAAGH